MFAKLQKKMRKSVTWNDINNRYGTTFRLMIDYDVAPTHSVAIITNLRQNCAVIITQHKILA